MSRFVSEEKKRVLLEYIDFEMSHFQESGLRPSVALMDIVDADLNPPLGKTSLKFLIGFIASATITLLFCPQFGLGPFLIPDLIGKTLMRIGAWVCAAYCASVFFGLSVLMVKAFLTPDEWRLMASHRIAWVLSLVGTSAAGFWLLGRADKSLDHQFLHLDQTFLIFWMATGAIVLWLSFGRSLRSIQV